MSAVDKVSEVRDLLVILRKSDEQILQHLNQIESLRSEQENIAKQLAALEDDLRKEIKEVVTNVMNRQPWLPPENARLQ